MNYNKGLRREDARACQVHNAVYAEAVRRLERDGHFRIRDVLETTRYSAMATAIRWDYIVEFIREDHKLYDLTALSQAYYEPHKKEDEYQNPGRYVAYGGSTGSAVGYALVTERNRHLVVARLRQRYSILAGTTRRFQGCVDEARTRLKLGEAWMPSIEDKDDAAA